MNYVVHLNSTFERFCSDERLSAFHVSLYYSLFQFWNMARFRNPLSVNRSELMNAAKIGSVNTYIRCMKELHQWEYLKYIPSYNPHKGSQVYLFSFNNSNNNSINNGSNISTHKTSDKASAKASKIVVIPSINSLNNTNNLNSVNGKQSPTSSKKYIISNNLKKTKYEKQQSEIPAIIEKKPQPIPSKKNSTKKFRAAAPPPNESSGSCPVFKRPSAKDVAAYFNKNKWPELECEKFFNHYESNGWLVGGKSPMQNWKAAAKKWMLNYVNFVNAPAKNTFVATKQDSVSNKLNTNSTKKYDEPL